MHQINKDIFEAIRDSVLGQWDAFQDRMEYSKQPFNKEVKEDIQEIYTTLFNKMQEEETLDKYEFQLLGEVFGMALGELERKKRYLDITIEFYKKHFLPAINEANTLIEEGNPAEGVSSGFYEYFSSSILDKEVES